MPRAEIGGPDLKPSGVLLIHVRRVIVPVKAEMAVGWWPSKMDVCGLPFLDAGPASRRAGKAGPRYAESRRLVRNISAVDEQEKSEGRR